MKNEPTSFIVAICNSRIEIRYTDRYGTDCAMIINDYDNFVSLLEIKAERAGVKLEDLDVHYDGSMHRPSVEAPGNPMCWALATRIIKEAA